MKKMVRGEITAFLSLIFLLLLSLVGATVESASIQVMKNERRADVSRALESSFAEYQRQLFENYKIFSIEASYETGTFSKTNILNRLSYYGAENIELEMEEIRYLTDQNGMPFYEQAVRYEKEKTGMDRVESLIGNIKDWNLNIDKYESYDENQRETSNKLNQMLQESEIQLPTENNPLETMSGLHSKSICSLLLPDGFHLSEKELSAENLVSKRELRTGNWSDNTTSDGTIFFNLYLMEHFGNACNKRDGTALDYELEYLLAGKASDRANVEAVLKNLSNIRFGINYIYLLSDQEKQAEARVMAAGLCSLLTIPGITEIVAQSILLAWAYAEALVDVKTLISGGKVALLKNKSNWKLSLENLITFGNGEGIERREDDVSGIDYKTYLQMMLYSKNKSILRMRALDIIEQNLKQSYSFFQTDNCVTGLKIQANCSLRRGTIYHFATQYHYQ